MVTVQTFNSYAQYTDNKTLHTSSPTQYVILREYIYIYI